MNLTENRHYINKHGQQLRDFILSVQPELWEHACQWSVVKYYLRAGKKEGESQSKDLRKCNDYLDELQEIDPILYDRHEVLDQLAELRQAFEVWEG